MSQQQPHSRTGANVTRRGWFREFPDPMVLIFMVLVAVYLLTFIIPAGEFARELVDGRSRVISGSFQLITETAPLHVFELFLAIPQGMINAAPFLFIVFIAGGLFHVLQSTGALENLVGVAANKVGAGNSIRSRNLIIVLGTFIYGFFGVAVGGENNIALVPVGVLIASAIGCSRLVGVTMAVGGIGIGFALSPISPYTVGVAQSIGELPLFSGWELRILMVLASLAMLSAYLCLRVVKLEFHDDQPVEMSKSLHEYRLSRQDLIILGIFLTGLVTLVTGVFTHGWYIKEITAIFLMMAIVIGFAAGMSAHQLVKRMMEGAASVTSGALVIGLAASIPVILQDAQIIDTIVKSLSSIMEGMPVALAAVVTSIIQGVINLFIPSGSAQALITMPILIPLADLIGMSRQLMVSAFQIGDGLTNLFIPTAGGILAMLALGRVSYAQWLPVIVPIMVPIYALCWVMMVAAAYLGY
ncbi:YfcC family protein [Oceanisphaera psychrotolerans]|uniref:C4-dicarboxylate ABC transporter n=1 Tax=Oceanisphaera psychrotolerans TaxID=1414654 RepID=A0A1J4QI71_9GAMM|nr:Na+/H+ antiporter NhaC family protein [Oceanisphaera psychrotolerans]OIN13124.1 C4-dicarboxylate ABC transporter [Oceanisphaera psychrotolerans]